MHGMKLTPIFGGYKSKCRVMNQTDVPPHRRHPSGATSKSNPNQPIPIHKHLLCKKTSFCYQNEVLRSEFEILNVVVWLDQPGFGDRLQSAYNCGIFVGLHHGSSNRKSNLTVRGLNRNRLEVGVLPSVLVRGSELPSRVSVPHVLCFIRFLSAYLTDLCHLNLRFPALTAFAATPNYILLVLFTLGTGEKVYGAASRTRTGDPSIFSALLYQLSYRGTKWRG